MKCVLKILLPIFVTSSRYIEKTVMEFEPKIVALLCNWCSYTGADLVRTARTKYAPNVRIIRVMCCSHIDPSFVLKAFKEGADGVIIAGCHPAECHYNEGSHKIMKRIPLIKELLKQMGINDKRLRFEWVSASEGTKFAEIVNKMTEEVRALGPFKVS